MKILFSSLYKLPKKAIFSFIKSVKSKANSSVIAKALELVAQKYPLPLEDRRELFAFVYENEEYNENRIRQLIFRVNKEIEQFIVQQKTNPIDKEFELFIHYHQLGQEQKKKQQLRKINSMNDEANPFSSTKISFLSDYARMFELQDLDRTKDRFFQEANHSLDQYFILEKLKLVSATLMHGKILKIKYHLGIYESLEPIIERMWNQLNKNVQLLYHAINMISKMDEDAYYKIKKSRELLTKNRHEENKQIVTMCTNFCIQKINEGDKNWLAEIFSWYKLQIKAEYIFEDGEYLTDANYKNIISTAILLNEIHWAKSFCSDYNKYLNPEVRQEQFQYNLARIYYHTKDYNKVIESLSKLDPKDTLLNIAIRVLMIKTWYVQDEYEILDSNLESFKIYLYRHKNMGYHYTMHSNFIKILRQLIQGNIRSKAMKTQWIEKITNLNYVSEKAWLIDLLR